MGYLFKLLSHEFQIMEGHMGDYWKQANGAIDIRAYQREYIMIPVADVRAGWLVSAPYLLIAKFSST